MTACLRRLDPARFGDRATSGPVVDRECVDGARPARKSPSNAKIRNTPAATPARAVGATLLCIVYSPRLSVSLSQI